MEKELESFFELDENLNKSIALSENELFEIMDKSAEESSHEKGKETTEDQQNYMINFTDKQTIEPSVPDLQTLTPVLSNGEDINQIVTISLKELSDYYEKKNKEKYLIQETVPHTHENENYIETDRNKLLDKMSENLSKNIIPEDEGDLLSDSINVIHENEDTDVIEDSEIDFDSNELMEENNTDSDEHLDRKALENLASVQNGEEDSLLDQASGQDSETKKKKAELMEMKEIIEYLDELLDELPNEKIKQFAGSKYFHLYKKVLKELGIV